MAIDEDKYVVKLGQRLKTEIIDERAVQVNDVW